jgi:hypothetical protein
VVTWTVASKGHSSARTAVQKRQSSAPYVFRNSRVGSAAAPRPEAVAAAATPSGSLLPRYLAGQDQRWWGRPPTRLGSRPVALARWLSPSGSRPVALARWLSPGGSRPVALARAAVACRCLGAMSWARCLGAQGALSAPLAPKCAPSP